MGSISKSFSLLLIVLLAVSSLTVIFATIPFGLAQSGTNVSGIIRSNTTWTEAKSPYDFTGPVTVNKGVTLIIESGVTVNINEFYLQVNGTIKAQGTNDKNIIIVSGFHASSRPDFASYNIALSDDSSDCVFENTVFSSTAYSGVLMIIDKSVMINNDTFNRAQISILNSATISNSNIMGGIEVTDCSAVISNNTINSGFVGTGISLYSNSEALISNNTIIGDSSLTNEDGILLNEGTNAVIFNNYISNYSEACIDVNTGSPLIGSPIIERNIIADNVTRSQYEFGFGIEVNGANPLIENNTFTSNFIGLDSYNYIEIGTNFVRADAKPIVMNNNFYGNNFNIYLGYPNGLDFMSSSTATASDVNATNNYWGTVDTQTINQTIYDSKNNFNLGTVTFVPFLTSPNPEAMPNPNAPIPTLNPTAPTPTPSTLTVPEFPSIMISIIVVLLVGIIFLLIYMRKRKTINSSHQPIFNGGV